MSMDPEQQLWSCLAPRLAALHPIRVENILRSGTPDVNYSMGWIELKHHDKWPLDPIWPLVISTMTERPEQMAFLLQRWMLGGLCWLMLRVNRQIMLFPGLEAWRVRKGLTRHEMIELSSWRTSEAGRASARDWAELLLILSGRFEELGAVSVQARLMRQRCNMSVFDISIEMRKSKVEVEQAERGQDDALASDIVEYFSC